MSCPVARGAGSCHCATWILGTRPLLDPCLFSPGCWWWVTCLSSTQPWCLALGPLCSFRAQLWCAGMRPQSGPTGSCILAHLCVSVRGVIWAPPCPALSLFRSLADHAKQAGGPGLSQNAFILGALRELGIAMCRGCASLGRSGLHALTRASGRAPLRGLTVPPLRWSEVV
jgi:hypothetical protein